MLICNFSKEAKRHKNKLLLLINDDLIIRVARLVNIKLSFTDQLFCNLIMLINWCKIQYLNLEKALVLPRSQIICLENWELWRAPTTVEFNIYCWNFVRVSVLRMSTKGCMGFFLFCLDLLSVCRNQVLFDFSK